MKTSLLKPSKKQITSSDISIAFFFYFLLSSSFYFLTSMPTLTYFLFAFFSRFNTIFCEIFLEAR